MSLAQQAPSPTMQSATRSKRSAALKALEKISAIAKEAEKYDDYGMETEGESIKDNIFSVKETPVEAPTIIEIPKKTPNTLLCIPCDAKDESLRAYNKYQATLKPINVANVKEYLTAAENKQIRYYVIPEWMKYLIANPALMMNHYNFGTAVMNKMNEFEEEMATGKAIGTYEITEEYRREFIALAKILKKVATLYGKLNLHHESFYKNITTIADSI